MDWDLVLTFLKGEMETFWKGVKNGAYEAKDWGFKMGTFINNPYFCNMTTSCNLVFEANPACPIPTNSNQPGCFPPCTMTGCRFIYREETKCPKLICTELSQSDYLLVFGLLTFVFLTTFGCTCCICYFKCNRTFRRMTNALCDPFHNLGQRLRSRMRPQSRDLHGRVNLTMSHEEDSFSWRRFAPGTNRTSRPRSVPTGVENPIIRQGARRQFSRSLENIEEREPLRSQRNTPDARNELENEIEIGVDVCENPIHTDV